MTHRPAPLPADEADRLAALERLQVLDSLPEQTFDDIVALASQICGTPIGLVSLIDSERQWFKARVGLDARETHRDLAFCGHAILEPDRVFTVADATSDARFAESALVHGEPHIRFYAGAPIVTDDGFALGTVCVIDTVSRELAPAQLASLQALARQTAALLQLRRLNLRQERQAEALQRKVTDALADDAAAHAGLRQAQRLEAVGQLTGGIAHDFNNVLQSITGCLELIRRKTGDAALVTRWATSGLKAVAHAGQLTSQLLAFSRNRPLAAQAIQPGEQVASMASMLGRTLGPDIALEFDVAAKVASVMADPTQLEAALMNLCINARDAMEGCGRIRIAARQATLRDDAELPDGDYVEISVADEGCGMTPEVARQAFDAFFTTKDTDKGTGLGLAQVAGFARKAGGAARLRSVPREGTVVSLLLRATSPTADDAPSAPPSPAGNPSDTGVRLLIVDDDEPLRDVLGALLEDAGHAVQAVGGSPESLEAALRREVPGVALVDFSLATTNGQQVASTLRRLEPGLPIVFMTGHADLDAIRQAIGPDFTILRKPLLLADVGQALQAELAKRRTLA